jgi:hypothetical protein
MHNWHAADVTGKSAALSGISRASRMTFVLIQRLTPVFLPVISAGNLQNLHKNCIFPHLGKTVKLLDVSKSSTIQNHEAVDELTDKFLLERDFYRPVNGDFYPHSR